MSSNIGRNDPCPCGSGLKFKKCCIDKPLNLFPHLTPERRYNWSIAEIHQIPTDKIIEKLVMCGIPFTREEFLKDVHNHYGSGDINNEWQKRYTIQAEGFDGDFPWLAAEVLWRRLASEKISTMQLDDWMQDGYALIGSGNCGIGKGGGDGNASANSASACRLWLAVWSELKMRFTPDMKNIDDADIVFQGGQSVANWVFDLEMELGNAAHTDKSFFDRRITFCRECMEFFPDSHHNSISMRRGVAEALYMSGRIAEAEKEFQILVSAFPDDPWSYAAWGDMYADVDGGAYNPEKAEELYHKGLGLEPREDRHLEDRIRALKVDVLKPVKR